MTIREEVLAYLMWKREATTAEVSAVVVAGDRGVLHELRRLAIQKKVAKTVKRDFATGRHLACWKLN